MIVGDFNTPHTPMDRSSKQKINKETQVLNDTLDEMDLTDIFRTSHPNARCNPKNTLSSQMHGTFYRIDCILGHKSNLSKFNKIEIISSIFSNHNTAAAAAKSLQSWPTLCDPTDSSHQAPPYLGFSRQEHWSGLPFPSPMHESIK